jgi:hypothetical protein
MKLFLKILLSVTLLGVVVGVSYLKTVPEDKPDSTTIVEPFADSVNGAKTEKTEAVDGDVTDSKSPQSESMSSKSMSPNSAPSKSISSDIQPPKVMALNSGKGEDASNESVGPAIEDVSVDSAKLESDDKDGVANSDKGTREEQIILYFRQKLSALPDDLSSYEKKVAIKEVRDETCELFHISRVKLSQLARVHKIAYP